MANARMRLKELADKIPRSTIERACFSVHGDDQPPFRANVSVFDSWFDLRYFGSGQALTKKDAEEIAAADALFKAGVGAGAKRSSTTAVALGASAAQDILSGIAERKQAIGAALAAKTQELFAAGLSAAVVARLLDCSAEKAGAVLEHMQVDDIKVAERFAMYGKVCIGGPAAGPVPRALQLDDVVALLVHHLHFKLRKGGAWLAQQRACGNAC
jgi:hypothetical protein